MTRIDPPAPMEDERFLGPAFTDRELVGIGLLVAVLFATCAALVWAAPAIR